MTFGAPARILRPLVFVYVVLEMSHVQQAWMCVFESSNTAQLHRVLQLIFHYCDLSVFGSNFLKVVEKLTIESMLYPFLPVK
jgi:hypothetical protein